MRVAPWNQTAWDVRAAGNFAAGGTGTGLALCAAAASVAGYGVSRPAFVTAALLVAAGLGCVALEIGRPLRFLRVFAHPETSWMTREAIVAPLLLAALTVVAWSGRSEFALTAGVLGAAMLYCQARMPAAAKGIPAWREPLVVPLFVATGLAEGAGAFAVLDLLSGRGERFALAFLLACIAARAVSWSRYRSRVFGRPAPDGTRTALARIDRPLLVFGTLLPWALACGALLLSLADALPVAGATLSAGSGMCALAGGWLCKLAIVTRAGYTQAFALPKFPVRGAGAGGPGARPGWS